MTWIASLLLIALGVLALYALGSRRGAQGRRRRPSSDLAVDAARGHKPPKPEWVRQEVLRLRALTGEGCRHVASVFNLLHARSGESVGKTFVAELVRKHGEEILRLRRELKHRKPRRVPRNLLWALDLTFLAGPDSPRPVLGLLDHGSRACLALTHLRDRSTIGILRLLLDAIEHFGKPRILRTDNEAVFTSRLFRFDLWLLRIRHQRTTPHCPWQNGRVERFFVTFKEKILDWFEEEGVPDDPEDDLRDFRAWYNHARPHQHLHGITPAMAWSGNKTIGRARPKKLWLWNGKLSGYLVPS